MMEKEQTALQLIAEAARCPVYEAERILALMEKLGINEKGFALLMNVAPFTVRLWTQHKKCVLILLSVAKKKLSA